MDIWLLLYALTFLFAIPRTKWHRKQNRKVIIIPDPTVNLSPNANGDLQQWQYQEPTSGYHYDKVDDPPATPDTSTYIYGTVNNSSITDIYQLQDFTPAGAYINQIKVFIRVKSNVVGTQFYAVIKTGGTIYQSGNLGDAKNTWTTYSNIWASNPQTGNPWTPAEINALQAGVKAWFSGGSAVDCTMVYVEVTYVIPPATPTNCTVSILSETSLRVSWTDASTDEDDFHVERKISGGSYSEVQVVTSTTKTTTGTVYTWDNSGLLIQTSYYYRVRAHRHSDNQYSYYSNEAYNTTPFYAPTNLVAISLNIDAILIQWNDNSQVESDYHLERKTSLEPTWAERTTMPANSTQFTDPGLDPAIIYTYRVRAHNHAQDIYTTYSNEASEAPKLLAQIPFNPFTPLLGYY